MGGTGSQKTATSSYSWANTGVKTKSFGYYSGVKRGRYMTWTSSQLSGLGITGSQTWAAVQQPIFSTGTASQIDEWIPQIEFVTSGCTSESLIPLASCTTISNCAQCKARADCAFKETVGCKTKNTYSSYDEVTECPPPCSSFEKCYECRDDEVTGRDGATSCYWTQSKNAYEDGDFSGSSCSEISPENSDNNYENTTHATNYSCQNPEATASAMETCNAVGGTYNVARIGYVALAIGCMLQLVGVCSWCGVKKDARSNIPLLCTGCNMHWVAGLTLMIWGCYWMFATPYGTMLFLFFAYIVAYFLPCLLAIPVGIISLVNICPAAKAGGKVEQTEVQAQEANPKNAL